MGAVVPSRLPLLGKGVAAAAAFAEEVGCAAGTTAQAGASVTAATAAVVVAIAEGSIATVISIWTGVDLINVTVLAEDGEVTVDDGYEAANFLESQEGIRWVSAPLAMRAEIAAQVRGLSSNVASGALHRTRLNASGHFCEIEALNF